MCSSRGARQTFSISRVIVICQLHIEIEIARLKEENAQLKGSIDV